MAKRFITPSGVKSIYSLTELKIKHYYLDFYDLKHTQLHLINPERIDEIIVKMHYMTVELLKKLLKKEDPLLPTVIEVGNHLFGRQTESKTFTSSKSIMTHQELLDIFINLVNHHLTTYQNFRRSRT